MKTTYIAIIGILICVSAGINVAFAEQSSVVLTPFDMSFSENNFTKSGPLHQILILKPNETTSISITINNHDAVQHEINLSIPSPQNISDFVDSYFFEPSTVVIKPNSVQQVLLHIKIKEKTETHWGIVPLVAQSKGFGIVGKYFYLVIDDKNKITETDLSLVDHSMREGLPGAAFPDLYDDYRSKPSDLQSFFDSITANKFGIPRYLPLGYTFQGLSRGTFVYSHVPVTSSTESTSFWRSGGMIILYQINEPNFDLSNWMPAYVTENEGQEIMVNGMLGVATEQQERVTTEGLKYEFPSQVQFFKQHANVELRGNMPLKELLKVAASIPQPDTDNIPVVIKQVELYGPMISKNDTSTCQGDGNVIGSQWFELYNTENKTIHVQGYHLDIRTNSSGGGGGTLSSIEEITLGPHKNCIYVLWAVGQAFISDPRNVSISFAYNDYNGTKYVASTPSLTDTYNDTRTWNLDSGGNWIFSAPSPMEQARSGVTPESIVCNNEFNLVINTQTHRPACVKPSHMVRLESSGWLEEKKSQYIPILDRPYNSGPGFGCPFIFPHVLMNDSSGFERKYNDSDLVHYVLRLGQNGTLDYTIHGDSYGLDPPIFSPSKVNVTNGDQIYYHTTDPSGHNVSPFKPSDVTILFEPRSEILDYDGHVLVHAKISVSPTAEPGTYWIGFVPGGCSEIPIFPLDVEK
jgi:hypothetical protein